jgi:CSLREA domain-containing protein
MTRAVVGGLLGVLLGAGRVDAATFAVNSIADAVDAVPGDSSCLTAGAVCSVRAAIQEANALAGPDEITIPAGTYVLSLAGTAEDAAATGDLDITSELDLTGAGADVTIIDGNLLDRVVHCLSGSMVSITGLTIQRGRAVSESGGGILQIGTLTLTQVHLRNNESTGNGGGLFANGSPLVLDSLISGNTAAAGGGVASGVFASPSIVNSTVSGNSGGGIAFLFSLGGLTNATVTDNTGGGVTFEIEAVLQVANSIISGNTFDGMPADCPGGAQFFYLYSQGYNLLGQGCTPQSPGPGDMTGILDPHLGPLQDNGGPTLTHEPLPTSPALEGGNPATPGSGYPACVAADQRGVARPQGAVCDIGAVESTSSPVPCGGGTLHAGEECDDGNTADGDGCSATCVVETCFACSGEPSVCAPIPDCPESLDHYKCYSGKDLQTPPFHKRTTATADQLSSGYVIALKLAFVCVPVNMNGDNINNPDAHLVCYQTTGDTLEPRPHLEVSTQFQTSSFEVKKPKLLCVPATLATL